MEGHPGKVLVGTPSTGGNYTTQSVSSRLSLNEYDLENALAIWLQMGAPEDVSPDDLRLIHAWRSQDASGYVGGQRNALCAALLDAPPEVQWILMVDTDMVFEADSLHKIVVRAQQHDLKILGGLCCLIRDSGGVAPTIYIDDPNAGTRILLDYPDNELAQVAATGGAFLLIHRDVVDAMADKCGHRFGFFTNDVFHGEDGSVTQLGEDISFCLRAGELGFPTVVDTTLHIGHQKGFRVYWPEDIRKTPCKVEDFEK